MLFANNLNLQNDKFKNIYLNKDHFIENGYEKPRIRMHEEEE